MTRLEMAVLISLSAIACYSPVTEPPREHPPSARSGTASSPLQSMIRIAEGSHSILIGVIAKDAGDERVIGLVQSEKATEFYELKSRDEGWIPVRISPTQELPGPPSSSFSDPNFGAYPVASVFGDGCSKGFFHSSGLPTGSYVQWATCSGGLTGGFEYGVGYVVSQWRLDTLYTARFSRWVYSRNFPFIPAAQHSGLGLFPFPLQPSSDAAGTFYPNNVQAHYTVSKQHYPETAVSVVLSGPSSITVTGNYAWLAEATGGVGTEMYYSWSQRPASGGGWVTTCAGFARTTCGLYLTSQSESFYLKARATSTGNLAFGEDSILVNVDISEDPLTVQVGGVPQVIVDEGQYTWVAVASGGQGNYQFMWEYSPDAEGTQFQVVGTGPNYSRTITKSDPVFAQLRVTVTSGGNSSVGGTLIHNETNNPCLPAFCF